MRPLFAFFIDRPLLVNLGMLFVFFLGSAAVVSILHTYHTLGRLEFRPGEDGWLRFDFTALHWKS